MKIAELGKVKVFYEDTIQDWNEQTPKKTLANIIEGYPKEKVLYFKEDRVLSIDPDIIEASKLIGRMGGKDSFVTQIENGFNMCDQFIFRDKKIGDPIENGYMQVVNLMFGIRLCYEKDIIVAIEFPEMKLHECLRKELIRSIATIANIQKLYIVTRSESIYKMIVNANNI